MTRSLPKPAVVDASALLERLLRGRRGGAVEQAVGESQMVAPHHIDVEVLNALRGLVRSGVVTEERAGEAVTALRDAPLDRIDTRGLIPRIWAWHHNLSAYDAAYAVLAEVLECPLVTADRRLGRAAGLSTPIVLV